MNFKDAAILSSDLYLDFLINKQLGNVEYKIQSIYCDELYFYLKPDRVLKNPDTLQMRINTKEFSNEEIKIVSYDKDDNILKISANYEAQIYLLKANPDEVVLFADLKFLIENVSKFYKKYGNMLSFPKHINNVPYYKDENLTDIPSDEQKAAVIGALSNPLSYIWGAPGTGKTKFVLARCVLSYLENSPNAKILITAPTNNAVEQTLFSVLPVLKSCGIDLKKVFRLGSPSSKFYNMYPECCEYGKSENIIIKLQREIDSKSFELKLCSEYKKQLQFTDELKDFESKYDNLSNLLFNIKLKIEKLKLDSLTFETKIIFLDNEINNLEKNKNETENDIEKYRRFINKNNSGLKKFFFNRKIKYYSELLKQSLEELKDINNKIEKSEKSILESDKIICKLNAEIENCEEDFEIYKTQLLTLSTFWKSLFQKIQIITIPNCNVMLKRINEQITQIHNVLDDNKKKYSDFFNLSFDEVNMKIDSLTSEICTLKEQYNVVIEQTSSHRIIDCNILAATIDTCIKRVSPNDDFKPTHIFLDEAGYCPLIKGATLLAYSCPLTLLGDHMQLPPICVMNDKKIKEEKNNLIALYAQSALYIEDITEEPFSIVNNYFAHNQPKFKELIKYNLNYTFRFGEKLAEILAKTVYTSDFHGTDEHKTDIYYINSPKLDPPKNINGKGRYSTTEIDNIHKYVIEHPNENIGIITPYKHSQQEKIAVKLKNSVEVFTVHGSQGREWDTVLFSVVDTTNKWFTNSNLQESNGKNVINTAVSRAKKKLIIVCDVNHWSKQNNQLIGQLLQIADELPKEQQ